MPAANTIQHKGFIDSITDQGVRVKFISESACSACHAKGVCSAADMKDKEIVVANADKSLRVGDNVNILMSASQGSKAVLIGYVYPFFLFLFSLLLFNASGTRELPAGLLSLSMLIPYYLGVYFFRNRINRNFNFSIDKEG